MSTSIQNSRRSSGLIGSFGVPYIYQPSANDQNIWAWWRGDESYTDTACTVLATDGQSVAGMKNLSSRVDGAPNLTQPTAGYRATKVDSLQNGLPGVYQNEAGQGTMYCEPITPKGAPLAVYLAANVTTGYTGFNTFSIMGGQTTLAGGIQQGWNFSGGGNPGLIGYLSVYWITNTGGGLQSGGYPVVDVGVRLGVFALWAWGVGDISKVWSDSHNNTNDGQPYMDPITRFRIGNYIDGTTSSPGLKWTECLVFDSPDFTDIRSPQGLSVLRYFNNKYNVGLTI